MDGERGWDTERAICRPIKFLGGREGRDEMPRMETPNVNIGSRVPRYGAAIKMEFRGRTEGTL